MCVNIYMIEVFYYKLYIHKYKQELFLSTKIINYILNHHKRWEILFIIIRFKMID